MSKAARIIALPRRIAVGDLPVRRCTSQSVLASSSPAGTTWLTRPISAARCASIGSPVRHSSAMWRGVHRCCSTASTCAGNRPIFTSGRPKLACSAATARSHIAMKPMPPARQWPLTRAISGSVVVQA